MATHDFPMRSLDGKVLHSRHMWKKNNECAATLVKMLSMREHQCKITTTKNRKIKGCIRACCINVLCECEQKIQYKRIKNVCATRLKHTQQKKTSKLIIRKKILNVYKFSTFSNLIFLRACRVVLDANLWSTHTHLELKLPF